MAEPSPILTLTLNPALDMATDVAEIIAGQKLRCSDPLLDPGGGGLNVSRAIRALGGDSLALVAIGGLTGDRLAGLIREAGVTFLSILGPGETRLSLTVTEETTGKQFRFMLPGPVWGAAERARVFTLLRATARPGGLSVISGSQPLACPPISRRSWPSRCRAAGWSSTRRASRWPRRCGTRSRGSRCCGWTGKRPRA